MRRKPVRRRSPACARGRHGRLRFRRAAALSHRRSRFRGPASARPGAGELSPQRAPSGATETRCSCSTGGTGNGARELGGARAARPPPWSCSERLRAQTAARDLHSCSAPEACAPRLHGPEGGRDGRGAIRPVFTRTPRSARVNLERMRANVDRGGRAMRDPLAVPTCCAEEDLNGALVGLKPAGCLFLRRGRARRRTRWRRCGRRASSEPQGQVRRYRRPRRGSRTRRGACRRPRSRCPRVAGSANLARRYGRRRGARHRPVGARRLALTPRGNKRRPLSDVPRRRRNVAPLGTSLGVAADRSYKYDAILAGTGRTR